MRTVRRCMRLLLMRCMPLLRRVTSITTATLTLPSRRLTPPLRTRLRPPLHTRTHSARSARDRIRSRRCHPTQPHHIHISTILQRQRHTMEWQPTRIRTPLACTRTSLRPQEPRPCLSPPLSTAGTIDRKRTNRPDTCTEEQERTQRHHTSQRTPRLQATLHTRPTPLRELIRGMLERTNAHESTQQHSPLSPLSPNTTGISERALCASTLLLFPSRGSPDAFRHKPAR